jgi:hypothetical protein
MSVVLTVDTTPPANPALVINGGVLNTNGRPALVSITHGGGSPTQMKIWGDVEIGANPSIGGFEGDSSWIPYVQDTAITLSTGTARKRIYARLRDALGNVTAVFQSYIDYDPTTPIVTVVVEPLVDDVSLVSGHDEAAFTWESNVDFVEYQVRVVPTQATPHTGGSPIGSGNGSLNVAGVGSWDALTPVTTTIKTADLLLASPGDTAKIVKVYVKDALGVWSP